MKKYNEMFLIQWNVLKRNDLNYVFNQDYENERSKTQSHLSAVLQRFQTALDDHKLED